MRILDTLHIGTYGLNFSGASDLGIDENSEREAYPPGLTVMFVVGTVATGWPDTGNLITINLKDTFSQMLFTESNPKTTYTRGASIYSAGSSATLGRWKAMSAGEWTDVSLSNGWTNYGSVFPVAGYRMEVGGTIRFKGLIRNGTVNSYAFILPPEHRPSETLILATTSNGSFGEVRVTSSGQVIPYTPSVTTWTSLDGLTIHTEE